MPHPAAATADDADASSVSSASVSSVQQPQKKPKMKHGFKTTSAKKTTVSAGRPRTAAEKEALKKPGTQPTLFAWAKLPTGRPPKASKPPAAAAASPHTDDTPPPAAANPKSRGSRKSYTSYDDGEYKSAKEAILGHLISGATASVALKAVRETHPTIAIPRQTVNNWKKKLDNEAHTKGNKDDSLKTLAAYDCLNWLDCQMDWRQTMALVKMKMLLEGLSVMLGFRFAFVC
jgi:hypothetical protein